MPTGELEYGDVNPLAKRIREAIGASAFEKVVVTTPQFTRPDGKKVTVRPSGAAFLDALKTVRPSLLMDIGLGAWDEGHWLFPGEWYDYIPEGYEIVDIFDKVEKFKRGTTSNDIRHGLLAYGFKVTK